MFDWLKKKKEGRFRFEIGGPIPVASAELILFLLVVSFLFFFSFFLFFLFISAVAVCAHVRIVLDSSAVIQLSPTCSGPAAATPTTPTTTPTTTTSTAAAGSAFPFRCVGELRLMVFFLLVASHFFLSVSLFFLRGRFVVPVGKENTPTTHSHGTTEKKEIKSK